MFLGDVAQSTRRTQVGNRVSRRMAQHIIGHRDKRILLAKHLTVFTNEGQTVNIGVHNDAKIVATLADFGHNSAQILLQRLRIMGKIACGFTVQEGIFHAQSLQQLGQNDASDRVNRINSHLEMRFLDGLYID